MTKNPHKSRKRRIGRAFAYLGVGLVCLLSWLYTTSPYARISVVQQPYTTRIVNGQIVYDQHFSLQVWHGAPARAFGYWVKNAFELGQSGLLGNQPTKATTEAGIVGEIHTKRFDPSKPYLISGDQFSDLYARNLGVFYNDILNPNTAHSQKDWENRQRIYLQSTLYALDAFSAGGELTTTIEPIGPRSVMLVEVHPGSTPSDSLYGVLYAIDALRDEARYADGPYKLQTAAAAQQIIETRQADLKKLVGMYLRSVRDPKTGMARNDIVLSGARDGVHREGSFYDNVVLWHTLSLAQKLGASDISDDELAGLRQKILAAYWDESEGHFKDDLRKHAKNQNYSSDWLIALPARFLSPTNEGDLPYFERSLTFMQEQGITDPLPVKYTAQSDIDDIPWAVRTFAVNYGSDTIWSYWGAEYLTLLANLYNQTGDEAYKAKAEKGIAAYAKRISTYRGFPETFTPDGAYLQAPLYKSIRQTGWVVQYETAMYLLDPQAYATDFLPKTHETVASTKKPWGSCSLWLCTQKQPAPTPFGDIAPR